MTVYCANILSHLGKIFVTAKGVVLPGASAKGCKTLATPTGHEGAVGFNLCHASPLRDKERGKLLAFTTFFLVSFRI